MKQTAAPPAAAYCIFNSEGIPAIISAFQGLERGFQMSEILVTGGAGYIGSHTCLEMLKAGLDIVVVDNLCNSHREALRRVERLAGRPVPFYQTDIRDRAGLEAIFNAHRFSSVVHFAGLKAVGESVQKPLKYFDNNIGGTAILLDVMSGFGVKNLVFSSSATVYGDPHTVPITEEFPLKVVNPYGRTKLVIEEMLGDIYHSDPSWNIALLRYFNPVGAHESGLIGEDPDGIPSNLMPYITGVAVGKLPQLKIFGGDWPTSDGTGVRDYIHVVDLAVGHLRAIDKLTQNPGCGAWNLGTGRGCSVLEMVMAVEKASGRAVPYTIVNRRPGDAAEVWCDPSKAERDLGWKAELGLDRMCVDSWRWQQMNPDGYPRD